MRLLALAIASTLAACRCDPALPRFTASGTLVDASTGAPVPGAAIAIRCPGTADDSGDQSAEAATADTDAAGDFVLSAEGAGPHGECSLVATLAGFREATWLVADVCIGRDEDRCHEVRVDGSLQRAP